jgi:hypothetical protein
MSNVVKRQPKFFAPPSARTFEEIDETREQDCAKRDRVHKLAAESRSDMVGSTSQCEIADRDGRNKRRLEFSKFSTTDIVIRIAVTLIAPLGLGLIAIRRWRQRRRNAAALYALDDAVLKDIGVCRCAIEYIVREQNGESGKT